MIHKNKTQKMNKYFAIVDIKTAYVIVLCTVITYVCIATGLSFDLNITLLSIAVVFPLVFTIREAFKRRDNVLKLLSIFKSSLNAAYYCFAINNKLSDEQKRSVSEKLNGISLYFFSALRSQEYDSDAVRGKLDEVFKFLKENEKSISNGASMKIIRFLKDVHESVENTVGVKMHGTPISLRAYCLVFIYIFPFLFVPTLLFDLADIDQWIIYLISATHGFILISLYNVQVALEDPFDQVGLDDIKLEEFHFEKTAPLLEKA